MTRTVGPGAGKRKIAYWVAILYGSSIAMVMFGLGFQGFFSIGASDTWLTMLGAFTGTLLLLPLTIWAVFKPRMAACVMLVNALLVCALLFIIPALRREEVTLSVIQLIQSLAIIFVTYFLVPILLFYATSKTRGGDEGVPRLAHWRPRPIRWSGRNRQASALAMAVVLGLIAGSVGFHWGLFIFRVSLHQRDWWGAVGIFASSLALLPLSLTALLRPRWAAWAAFVSLAVTWAYALTGADFHGGVPIGGALLLILWTLPQAAVGCLLLFATQTRRAGTSRPTS